MTLSKVERIQIDIAERHSCPYCGNWFTRMRYFKEENGILKERSRHLDMHNMSNCRQRYFEERKIKEINYREVDTKDCSSCFYSRGGCDCRECYKYKYWVCRLHKIKVNRDFICDDWKEMEKNGNLDEQSKS